MAKPSLADWTGLFGTPRSSLAQRPAESGDVNARRSSSDGSVPHLAGVSLARARERAAQGVSQAEQNLLHTHHDGPVYQRQHSRVQSTDCSGPAILATRPQAPRRGSDELRAALAEAQAELVPALVAAPAPAHLMPAHARSRESSNEGASISRPITPMSRTVEPQLPPSWLAARGAGGSTIAPPSEGSESPPRSTRPPSLLRSLSSRSIHAAPPALATGSAAQLLRSTATGIISSPTDARAPTLPLPPNSLHAGDARPFATLARPGEQAALSSDYDGSTAAADLRDRRSSSDDVTDHPSIWDVASASLGLAPDVHGEHAHDSETGAGFFSAIERLRATLGLDKDGGDWIQSHRSALDAALAKATAAAASGTAAPASSDEKPEGKSVHIHPSKAQKEASSDKIPLVFAHGLFGFDQLALGPKSMPLIFNYWRGITEVLKERGTEVLVARVPASASIQERAEALRDVIERHFGGREINLIGHSMGGLDSRYLISRLETSFTVKSLTTIATPHRGSPFADYMLQQVIGKDNIPSLLSLVRAVGIPGGGEAFEQLQLADMAKFNEETPNREGVRYLSYGAAFMPGFLSEFRIPHGIIFAQEGPNDGLVSCSSAEWGEYRGTLAANHLELIGWINELKTRWNRMTGGSEPFDPKKFFLEVCEEVGSA